ncbi:hypothetical protein BDV24DRAFT_141294 [Aspergillus arachidicola]|uniref:Uncharacterized protein n=1 Tax=Aspergillus arachidicola TaxID=656916 RepID=A0A5N6XUF7_9EURO|nr:hypothetical protein BDV24DRAFT_141294 [Aspergillus arachidicola]
MIVVLDSRCIWLSYLAILFIRLCILFLTVKLPAPPSQTCAHIASLIYERNVT